MNVEFVSAQKTTNAAADDGIEKLWTHPISSNPKYYLRGPNPR